MRPKQEVRECVVFVVVRRAWFIFKTVGDTDGSRQTDTPGLYKLGHALLCGACGLRCEDE